MSSHRPAGQTSSQGPGEGLGSGEGLGNLPSWQHSLGSMHLRASRRGAWV